jgi:hypothetical protein
MSSDDRRTEALPADPGAARPDSGTPEPSEPVAAGGLGAVPLLFTRPAEAFAGLRPRPKWIGVLGLIVVLVALSTWIQLAQQLEFGAEITIRTMERFGAPEDAIEETLASLPDPDSLTIGDIAGQVAPAVITIVVVFFVGTAVLHLVAKIAGADPGFRLSLTVYALAFVPLALGVLVKSLLVRASDTMEVTLGPGILFPGLDYNSLPAILLDLLDVFSLWNLVLLAVGARVAYRVSSTAGWGISGTLWVLRSLLVFGGRMFGAWAAGS